MNREQTAADYAVQPSPMLRRIGNDREERVRGSMDDQFKKTMRDILILIWESIKIVMMIFLFYVAYCVNLY